MLPPMKTFLLLFILLFECPGAIWAQSDYSVWSELSILEKSLYIKGFLEGVTTQDICPDFSKKASETNHIDAEILRTMEVIYSANELKEIPMMLIIAISHMPNIQEILTKAEGIESEIGKVFAQSLKCPGATGPTGN